MESSTQNTTDTNDMRYFNLIYPPLFLLVGVPGNLFSMVIWFRRIRTSPGSTWLFLTILCGTDTYVLIHGCARVWLRTLGETLYPNGTQKLDLRYMLGCAPPLYLFTFTSDLSVWLIILLSFERFICAWFPLEMRTICEYRRGLACAMATIGFLALANTPLFALVRVSEEGQLCTRGNFSAIYVTIWSYFDFAIYSCIPLALIVLSNTLILIRLQQTRKRSRSSQNATGRILKTIVCMCIFHFLLTMPIGIYFMTDKYFCPVPVPGKRNICDPINEFFIMLQLANHLTHFFIYSCTSTQFKGDLINICGKRRRKSLPHSMANIGMASNCRNARNPKFSNVGEHREQGNGLLSPNDTGYNDLNAVTPAAL